MISTLTIDRAKWRTGTRGAGFCVLLNRRGYRCCLGFLGQARGLRDIDANVGYPSGARHMANWPPELFHPAPLDEDSWEDTLARINDASDIDDATREDWIATGFREVLGIEVTFVNAYPDGAK